jgi:spore germination protein KC
VDQLFIVSGLALDKDMETGEYLINFEIVKAKSGSDSQMGVQVISVRSNTVFEGIRDAIKQVGKKLYWGHTSVCIVSDTIVKEGLFLTLDSLARATDLKADIFICYSALDSLDKIFAVTDEVHDTVTEHLMDLFNESTTSGKYTSAPLYQVLKALSDKNGTILLPVLDIFEKNEESILITNGCVAVTKDHYIGYIDEIETRSVELLQNDDFNKGYAISMKANGYVPGAAVEVIDTKRNIQPVIEGGQLKMNIEIELECDLAELESSEDYIADDRKSELENSFEQMIKDQLSATISRTQRELGYDIFSFHTVIFQEEPNYWREIEPEWTDVFREMPYDIFIDINIYSSESNKMPLGYEGE